MNTKRSETTAGFDHGVYARVITTTNNYIVLYKVRLEENENPAQTLTIEEAVSLKEALEAAIAVVKKEPLSGIPVSLETDAVTSICCAYRLGHRARSSNLPGPAALWGNPYKIGSNERYAWNHGFYD